MASDFPAMLFHTGNEDQDTVMKTPKTGATFKPYALVVQDVSGGADDGTVDECGADPALILGLVMSAAVDANTPYGSKVPVVVLRGGQQVGLCVSGTLVAADEEKDFGIVKLASGNWALDRSDTVNTRFHVKRAITDRQIAIGHFLAANLQGDAVAS
jgi:hypothetical protein